MRNQLRRSIVFAAAVVALGAFAYTNAAAADEAVRLAAATGAVETPQVGADRLAPSYENARLCGDKGSLTLAQLQLRAPSDDRYVQLPGQRGFKKLSAGEPLPNLDCIEIECPASFPEGATCWRCVEQVKAPE